MNMLQMHDTVRLNWIHGKSPTETKAHLHKCLERSFHILCPNLSGILQSHQLEAHPLVNATPYTVFRRINAPGAEAETNLYPGLISMK